MNLSRLAVLAVFFMMVMSAFVTIPTYNVGADEHEDGGDDGDDHGDECPFDEDNPDNPCNAQECEDHESQECADYVDNYCANNDDPYCGPASMEMVCYDINNHEIDFDITNEEDCEDAGFMWVSPTGGPNDGDDHDDDRNLESFKLKVQMETLEDWLVMFEGQHSVEHSDEMRNEIAYQCSEMMGTSNSEITAECFSHFIEMMAEVDDDDHGDNGDYHGCPPDMSDETCAQWEDCDDRDDMNMSCMRIIYDYCSTSPHCSNDGNDNWIYTMFGYEDGDVTAEDFMNAVIDAFEMDDGPDDYDHADYVLYDLITFTVDYDSEIEIHQGFKSSNHMMEPFTCGDGSKIPFFYVNDGSGNCDDGADEQWYDSNTNDTSDDCQEWNDEDCEGEEVNWFDCHDGSFVWINQVNDGYHDCEDGEDEYWEDHTSFYGDIFLLAGDVSSEDIGTSFSADDALAMEEGTSFWGDDDKTYVDYERAIYTDLFAGESYTLVTVTPCSTYWDDDNQTIECDNAGDYEHMMFYSDGTEETFEGNITEDSPMTEIVRDYHGDHGWDFVLYDTYTFNVDEDFVGKIVSFGYECPDHDEDGQHDYCYGVETSLYLYDAFDENDVESGLIGSIGTDWNVDHNCPSDITDCTIAHMDLELSPGDYTVVTTISDDRAMFHNHIASEDNETSFGWENDLHNAYYEYDQGNRTLVSGDERIHMPKADYPEYDDHDDHDDDHDDDRYHVMMALMENFTAYEDEDMTAPEAADNVVELIYLMAEMGVFDDDHDDHDGDDHGDHMEWNEFSYCKWEGDDFSGPDNWYCDEDGDMEDFEDYWHYCEVYSDDDGTDRWVCTDDFGQNPDYEHSVDNTHYKDGGRPDYDDHDDNDDHNDDDDRGDHDDGEDNPALLDGIVGVQDPEDDDCVISSANMVGQISDNAGLPMMCSFEFKLHFEGADSSMMQHEAYIPFQPGDTWTLEFAMLEGYEFISCDICEVDANGIMTGTGPVKVIFGKIVEEEPQPDCDHVIGLDATGMAFDPIKLSIKVGETVCWQWKDAAMAHNVLELEGDYDSTMNLTNINFGFSSGEPSVTTDFRHTFTKDNMTHYYVCEPHAGTGMVGQITVGEGSANDPVQETIDDNEVPSVGFVVGSLVLVGAAGLRRRIH